MLLAVFIGRLIWLCCKHKDVHCDKPLLRIAYALGIYTIGLMVIFGYMTGDVVLYFFAFGFLLCMGMSLLPLEKKPKRI